MTANGALRAVRAGRRSMMVIFSAGLVAMLVDPLLSYGLAWGPDGTAIGLVLFRFVMMAWRCAMPSAPTTCLHGRPARISRRRCGPGS